MEYRQLGRSGLRVSKLCLGTMKGFKGKNDAEAKLVVNEALDSGVNFIDTSNSYGKGKSEEILGEVFAEDKKKRDDAVLATKFGWFMGDRANDYGAGRRHLIESCEKSLKRLQTDYIDLYIIHVVDPNTPMDELLYTFDMLVRSGKVRYIGTSKHPASTIVEGLFTAEKYGYPRFISEQPPYNLLDRSPENELLPACMKHGVGITPFSPVAGGALSGKYSPGEKRNLTPEACERIEKLKPLAEAKGATPAELALAWTMAQPAVTSAIQGARKIEYLRSGLKACDIELSEEELQEIDNIFPPGSTTVNFYEENIYRAYRMNYHAAARARGAGAYIPRTGTAEEDQEG